MGLGPIHEQVDLAVKVPDEPGKKAVHNLGVKRL